MVCKKKDLFDIDNMLFFLSSTGIVRLDTHRKNCDNQHITWLFSEKVLPDYNNANNVFQFLESACGQTQQIMVLRNKYVGNEFSFEIF